MDKITELQNQIDDLKKQVDSLKSNTTIPYDIAEAFKKRIPSAQVDSNSTAASTQTQFVNEGAVGTYNVAKPMTGFITVYVNGTAYTVPYY